ncbi:unnamed protein product, partial [Sphacelaria rigidula]
VRAVEIPTGNPAWVEQALNAIEAGVSIDMLPAATSFYTSRTADVPAEYDDENGTGARSEADRARDLGMPLKEYARQLSAFDVVLAANSLDDLSTKILMGAAQLANRPVRVLALCNVAPPPTLYAEAFVVGFAIVLRAR